MTIETLEPGDTIAYKTSHGWRVRTVRDDENIAQGRDVILLEAGDTPTSAAVIIEHGELPYDPELRRPITELGMVERAQTASPSRSETTTGPAGTWSPHRSPLRLPPGRSPTWCGERCRSWTRARSAP